MSNDNRKWAYFSVKKPIKLNGKKHMPCICYALPSADIDAMVKLSEQGIVSLWTEKVRFISGAPQVVGTYIGEQTVANVQADLFSASDNGEFARE